MASPRQPHPRQPPPTSTSPCRASAQSARSTRHPCLTSYRTLHRSDGHEHAGIFVAKEPKGVERALTTGLAFDALLCTERWYAHFAPLLAAQPAYVTDQPARQHRA